MDLFSTTPKGAGCPDKSIYSMKGKSELLRSIVFAMHIDSFNKSH